MKTDIPFDKMNITLRRETPEDDYAILRLTFEAFLTLNYHGRRRMDEHYLIHLLKDSPAVIPELCFVAEYEGEIVGHILYTKSSFKRPDGRRSETVTFAPLSVLPKYHRQGIGEALVFHTLEKAREMDYHGVMITGIPEYYPKLGFKRGSEFGLVIPDNTLPESFMVYELTPGYFNGGGIYDDWLPEFDQAENDDTGYDAFHKHFIAEAYLGKLIFHPIYQNDIPLLEDFLYLAIFLPPGIQPPSRDVIFMPDIYIYIKDYGQKDDCGIIAELDGKAVGAAWARIIPAFGHTDDETPELAISVLPDYRGQGIGTELLERLFHSLRERGYKQTSLSVQKENPAARLYQRMGYEIIRENEEDYIMIKDLEYE